MNRPEKNLLLERYAFGRESVLIDKYIANGPSSLQDEFGLSDMEWQVIFDYLVFEHNLLFKTVGANTEFFVDMYVKQGMSHLRDVLDVSEAKYDLICEVVFDLIAISNEGLYYHVLENRDRYMLAFKARGGDFVRNILGISKSKYDENWAKILDILLHAVCDSLFSGQTLDHGLRAFSYLMNGMRVHRPLAKSEIFRPGMEVG